MKARILESDRIVIVRPYYAQELVYGETKGVELDNIVHEKTMFGIVNGIDVQEWNPSTNKYINIHYNAAIVSLLTFSFVFVFVFFFFLNCQIFMVLETWTLGPF